MARTPIQFTVGPLSKEEGSGYLVFNSLVTAIIAEAIGAKQAR